MKKKKNITVLIVALILFCSNVFFMSYMQIDSDEIDSLYNNYFRTYQTGDFRSISSSIVSWESYIESVDVEGEAGGVSVVDRSSILAVLETMADWYLANVDTYSSHIFDDYYMCELIGASVRDDCSGFARAFASLLCGTVLTQVGSSTLFGTVPQDWYDNGWRCYPVSELSNLEIGDLLVRDEGNSGHVEVCMGARGTFGWGKVQTQCPSNTEPAYIENGNAYYRGKAYPYVVRYEGNLPTSSEDNSGSTELPVTSFDSTNWKQAVEAHYNNNGRSSKWTSVTHNGQMYIWEKQTGYSHTAASGSTLTGAGCMWFAMASAWTNLSGEVHGVNDCLSALGYSVDTSNAEAFTISPSIPCVGSDPGQSFNGVSATIPSLFPAITGYSCNDLGSSKSFSFGSDKLYIVHVQNDSGGQLSVSGQHWFVVVGEDGGDYLLLSASGAAATNGNRVSKSVFDSVTIDHVYEITK